MAETTACRDRAAIAAPILRQRIAPGSNAFHFGRLFLFDLIGAGVGREGVEVTAGCSLAAPSSTLSAAVVGLFFGLSYMYGEHVTALVDLIRRSEIGLSVVIGVAVALVACYFVVRRYRRQRQPAIAASGSAITARP